METLLMSFPWSGERQRTGAFREGMCTTGGALCLNTVWEHPIVGEDGSGTGHNKEGGEAGGEQGARRAEEHPAMAPLLQGWGRGLGREKGSQSSLAELGSPLPTWGPRMPKRRFYISSQVEPLLFLPTLRS